MTLKSKEAKRKSFGSAQDKWEKDFDKKFPARNDCTGEVGKHVDTCCGCIEIIIEESDEIKSFLRQIRQEAYEKGKREGCDAVVNEIADDLSLLFKEYETIELGQPDYEGFGRQVKAWLDYKFSNPNKRE